VKVADCPPVSLQGGGGCRSAGGLALRAHEQERLVAMLPKMEQTIAQLAASREVQTGQGAKIIAQISPMDA
jgi:c-di-GMP-binding flagellar brake protein YcgR